MTSDRELSELVQRIAQRALRNDYRIATAESCTGGWIAKAFTDLAGSSRWFECGWVTYSNEAKVRDLGVSPRTLDEHGAVSEPVVREMVSGALRVSGANIVVAVSGIAGPDGGSAEKPVGTVWFCAGQKMHTGEPTKLESEGRLFGGDREAVRRLSVEHALKLVLELLESPGTGQQSSSR
jgi:nicotinamide-nucleotide amidase